MSKPPVPPLPELTPYERAVVDLEELDRKRALGLTGAEAKAHIVVDKKLSPERKQRILEILASSSVGAGTMLKAINAAGVADKELVKAWEISQKSLINWRDAKTYPRIKNRDRIRDLSSTILVLVERAGMELEEAVDYISNDRVLGGELEGQTPLNALAHAPKTFFEHLTSHLVATQAEHAEQLDE
jgi:hypothetical protein